jgi:glycosyltransferase involved in cell wall biosynthesis
MAAELTVVIPAYNDQAGLEILTPELAKELQGLAVSYEILIVDDGSEPALVRPAGAPESLRLLRHPRNRGYGAAIKTGLRAASGPYVQVMDADNQHDPAFIGRFYSLVKNHDMVVGLRSDQSTSPLWRRPGKLFLTWFLNSLSARKVSDINCGFRCIRKEAIMPHLDLCSDRFSFSLSSTVLLLNRGRDVQFEPIVTRRRVGVSSVTLRTGFQTIILIIRLIVFTTPLRFFLPIAAALLALGVAWTLPYIWMGRGVSVAGLFLMISGMLTFFFGILAEQLSELLKRPQGSFQE